MTEALTVKRAHKDTLNPFYYDPFHKNINCAKDAKLFSSYSKSKKKMDTNCN
jgi:hypothetical protein